MMSTLSEHATRIEPDLIAEAQRLLREIDRAEIPARLIGGMAIRLLAGERLHPAFERSIQDLDFVLARSGRSDFDALLLEGGYEPEKQFNALYGAHRLLYHDPEHGRQIDVFVETFSMCHKLPLAEQIPIRRQTLPPVDVLMTKLQIVQLNEKDLRDIYALLRSHEVLATAPDGDAIDLSRMVGLTSDDWGLQHTFELNLDRLRDALPGQPIGEQDAGVIQTRIEALAAALESSPKTRKWKLRARVGERRRWYEEPEEVDR